MWAGVARISHKPRTRRIGRQHGRTQFRRDGHTSRRRAPYPAIAFAQRLQESGAGSETVASRSRRRQRQWKESRSHRTAVRLPGTNTRAPHGEHSLSVDAARLRRRDRAPAGRNGYRYAASGDPLRGSRELAPLTAGERQPDTRAIGERPQGQAASPKSAHGKHLGSLRVTVATRYRLAACAERSEENTAARTVENAAESALRALRAHR